MFLEFALIGTTASGKSGLALELAAEFGGVILSLDSLALYKQINIASAKPLLSELTTTPHFGINLIYPDEHFSAGEFAKEYARAKSYAQKLNAPLIITGGSGFYLKALLTGLAPKIDDIQTELSNAQIYSLATKIDPEFGAKFSQSDTYRLRKWYSIYAATGEVPSKFLKEKKQSPVISNLDIFEILWERDKLYQKVAKRTGNMLASGLIDEARSLFDRYGRETKALKCIGLKECALFLDEEISQDELCSLITIHTAQLAKRQRTFNRSQFTQNKFAQSYDETKTLLREFLRSKIR